MAYVDEVLADSPVGYWRLNETATGTTVDSSGNGRNGSGPVGGVTLGVASLLPTGGGVAAAFNGSTGRIPLPSSSVFEMTNAGDFTFEAWVKLDNPNADAFQMIATKTRSSTFTDKQWYVAYDNRSSQGSPQALRLQASATGTAAVDWAGAGTALAAGGYLVARKSGNEISLWWNGTQVSTATVTTWTLATNTQGFGLAGHFGGTFWLDGVLDEVAIYQSALSSTRIAAHYAAASPVASELAGSLTATLPALTTSLSGAYSPPPVVAAEHFIDKGYVATSTGVNFDIQNPAKSAANPLLGSSADTWDRDKSYVSTYRDGARTHLWYYAVPNTSSNFVCYAYSDDDGATWTKPSLGRVTYGGSTANNIIESGLHVSAFWDSGEGRWMFVTEPNFTIGTSTSPDGPVGDKKVVDPAGTTWTEGKDIIRLDDGTWLGYYSHGHDAQRRSIGMVRSNTADYRGTWATLGDALTSTSADHQFYSLGVEKVGGVFLGLVMVYQKSTEKIWMDLYSSRDALAWTLRKTNWIPLGAAGAWDDAMIIGGNSIVDTGTEWQVWYTGSRENHAATLPRDMQIGVATLERGRIAAVSGAGSVTTKLFLTGDSELTVNADAAAGSVLVEVLDAAGVAIGGYGGTLSTDSTAHVVTVPPAQEVSLRFTISGAAILHGYTLLDATRTEPVNIGSGSFAVTLPAVTASLAGTYIAPDAPLTGTLAGTLPPLTASFAGTYTAPEIPGGTGSLAATLPALTAIIAGSYDGPTFVEGDLTYGNQGYNYIGTARVFYDPPVAPEPTGIRRAKVKQVHQSLSAPTLVDGRPT